MCVAFDLGTRQPCVVSAERDELTDAVEGVDGYFGLTL